MVFNLQMNCDNNNSNNNNQKGNNIFSYQTENDMQLNIFIKNLLIRNSNLEKENEIIKLQKNLLTEENKKLSAIVKQSLLEIENFRKIVKQFKEEKEKMEEEKKENIQDNNSIKMIYHNLKNSQNSQKYVYSISKKEIAFIKSNNKKKNKIKNIIRINYDEIIPNITKLSAIQNQFINEGLKTRQNAIIEYEKILNNNKNILIDFNLKYNDISNIIRFDIGRTIKRCICYQCSYKDSNNNPFLYVVRDLLVLKKHFFSNHMRKGNDNLFNCVLNYSLDNEWDELKDGYGRIYLFKKTNMSNNK